MGLQGLSWVKESISTKYLYVNEDKEIENSDKIFSNLAACLTKELIELSIDITPVDVRISFCEGYYLILQNYHSLQTRSTEYSL